MRRRLFSCLVVATTLLGLMGSACGSLSASTSPAGLFVKEYALVDKPTLDPLSFQPVQGSMAAVTAAHASDLAKTFPDKSISIDGRFGLRTTMGSDIYTATLDYDKACQAGWVTLYRNETEIYRIDVGVCSPITPLLGLWVYDGHWVLETADISVEEIIGHLTRDGELLNASQGYSDMFGFQLMHGRPFFFFGRDGHLGYNYDGHEVLAGYDEIPRYNCCSESELNARQAQDMVSFFARRDQTWYYVEIGAFD